MPLLMQSCMACGGQPRKNPGAPELSITPAEGQVPTATINGSSIELTEDGGVYTGSFAMPAQTSTLVINTGSADNGGGDDQVDQD